MNNSGYYQFVKVQYPLIHIKMIGYWNENRIDEIGPDFLQELKKSVDIMLGKSFILIADLSEFNPNSERIHNLMGQGMKYAKEKGLYKAIDILPAALQRLGAKSAEQKSGQQGFRIIVENLLEAQSQYNNLKNEII